MMFLIFLIDTCLLFIMRLLVRLAPLGARQKTTRYAGARRRLGSIIFVVGKSPIDIMEPIFV